MYDTAEGQASAPPVNQLIGWERITNTRGMLLDEKSSVGLHGDFTVEPNSLLRLIDSFKSISKESTNRA
jgi:hypothetical protein